MVEGTYRRDPNFQRIMEQLHGDPEDEGLGVDVRRLTERLREEIDIRGIPSNLADNRQMDQVTPRELDAKIAVVRTEMDGRLARIEDKLISIDGHLGSTRNAVWGAAAVTIGAVLAAMALVVTSFDSGRDTSALVRDASKQLDDALAGVKGQQAATQALLERLSRRMDEISTASGATAAPTPPVPKN